MYDNQQISNFSGFKSTPIILEALYSLAPSATCYMDRCTKITTEERLKFLNQGILDYKIEFLQVLQFLVQKLQ